MDSNQKSSKEQFKSFIVAWNIRFKYDRLWRKKYNIPFGSEQHLKANQIDIYIDMYEDKVIQDIQLLYTQKQKDLEEYRKTGVFLKEEKMSEEAEDKLFKRIKFSK